MKPKSKANENYVIRQTNRARIRATIGYGYSYCYSYSYGYLSLLRFLQSNKDRSVV